MRKSRSPTEARKQSANESSRGPASSGELSNSLVGAVDIVDGQDGQVAVITEVTQGDAATGLQLQGIDFLLGDVEGNGHGEDIAIGKAAVLTDTEEKLVYCEKSKGCNVHAGTNRIIPSR